MSERVNALNVHSERFFTRLIMKVDDYGCFHANTSILKANLFPLLLDTIREADISRWIAECVKAGLIVLYESDSKQYLQIQDFKQRLDKAKSKFPLPLVNDFPEIVNDFPAEVEKKPNTKPKRKEVGAAPPPQSKISFGDREKEFAQLLVPHVPTYGKEMIRKFYDYWREPNRSKTKMRWERENTWDLNLRLQRWAVNNFDKGQPEQPTVKTNLSEVVKKLQEA